MNNFLLLVILCMCGGFYYVHQQDQQHLALLQSQLDEANARVKAPASNDRDGSSTPSTPSPAEPAPVVTVLPPDTSHSTAIDAAAHAAMAAQNSPVGTTIATLDGRTFQDCKILKVESDGITFSHSEGITKVLFPLLRPEMQKQYGYDAHAAVAQTTAQINYQEQVQQAAAASAATTGNPSP
jgi:hypothetical protein